MNCKSCGEDMKCIFVDEKFGNDKIYRLYSCKKCKLFVKNTRDANHFAKGNISTWFKLEDLGEINKHNKNEENKNMELKMGDEVEVRNGGDWNKRIFIKFGRDGGVICVKGVHELKYKNGSAFEMVYYEKDCWRIPFKKEYIPFDEGDGEKLIGKSIRGKFNKNHFHVILSVISGCVMIAGINGITKMTYQTLLDRYEFIDNSICGKEKI
jgi:hypothetical protein